MNFKETLYLLRTIGIAFWVIIAVVLFGTATIIASFLDSKGIWPHIVARYWARSILFVSRTKVTIKGLENIDPDRPYIFMPNHSSNFDIPVLLSHLRSGSFAGAQRDLLALDAVQVSPPLMAIERRGIFIFRIWSRFILGRKRAPAGWARRVKVALFSVYLPLVLFLVSPLVFLLAALGARLHPARTKREVDYHSGVDLRPPDA